MRQPHRSAVQRSVSALLVCSALSSSASGQALLDPLWTKRIAPPLWEALHVIPDPDGGTYFVRRHIGALGGLDILLQRRSAAGELLGESDFGSAADDFLADAAEFPSGGFVLSGDSAGDLGGTGAGGTFVARFDGQGQVIWVDQFPGSARSVAVAPDLRVVALYHDGAGLRLRWYTATGSLLVEATVQVPYAIASTQPGSRSEDLVAGSSGQAFVGWYINSASLFGTVISLHDAQGALLVEHIRNTNSWIGPRLAPDGAGGAFAAIHDASGGPGYRVFVHHYGPSGALTWGTTIDSSGFNDSGVVTYDRRGGCVVALATTGSIASPSSGDQDTYVAHYSPQGVLQAHAQNPRIEYQYAQAVAVDAAGGIVVIESDVGASKTLTRFAPQRIGAVTCSPAAPNSTGLGAELLAVGDIAAAADNVLLWARGLPWGSTGYFLGSMTLGSSHPPGSQGELCLGGAIGRFSAPGQIGTAGQDGTIGLALDLTAVPTPVGPVTALAGQTWSFQAWYRDANPGPTNNFTDAVSITFQ
ncbi:MAG: hypothetical protein R3F49_21700 [Planctomycetota bacterium]